MNYKMIFRNFFVSIIFLMEIKCIVMEKQNDIIETGEDLINKLTNAFFVADHHSFDQQKFIKELLCRGENEIEKNISKFVRNILYEKSEKMRKDFCEELGNEKSIEKATQKVTKTAIKLAKELENDENIKENIQKALKNKNEKIKSDDAKLIELKEELVKNYSEENLNKLKRLFYLKLNEFFTSIKDSKIEFFEPHKIGRRQKRVNVRELFQGAFQRIRQHGTQIECFILLFFVLLMIVGVIIFILKLSSQPSDLISWTLLLIYFIAFVCFGNKFIKECTACLCNNNNQIHSIELAENGPAAAGANGQ